MRHKETTMIELTEQQRTAVMKGEPVQLAAPELGINVMVLRADAYEEIREILAEEHTRSVVAKVAARNAAARAEEP
jgi:hypothetical protein